MKILHLSDFHFERKKDLALESIREKAIELLSKEDINFLIFSGDLVVSPNKIEDFIEAKQYLLDPLLESLKLTDESLFICPGNHDTQRNQELKIIAESFSKFRKVEEIDEFISVQNGQQLDASLANHRLFNNFRTDHIIANSDDIIEPLYTFHEREYNGRKIDFITINSAWRSISSEADPGNLYYPISTLKLIISQLSKDAFKILIMHHPLREFKEFVAREMEDLIFDNFHVLFTGHSHKEGQSLHFAKDV